MKRHTSYFHLTTIAEDDSRGATFGIYFGRLVRTGGRWLIADWRVLGKYRSPSTRRRTGPTGSRCPNENQPRVEFDAAVNRSAWAARRWLIEIPKPEDQGPRSCSASVTNRTSTRLCAITPRRSTPRISTRRSICSLLDRGHHDDVRQVQDNRAHHTIYRQHRARSSDNISSDGEHHRPTLVERRRGVGLHTPVYRRHAGPSEGRRRVPALPLGTTRRRMEVRRSSPLLGPGALLHRPLTARSFSMSMRMPGG